jgi:DNA-binding XRE family transcriptional regulator
MPKGGATPDYARRRLIAELRAKGMTYAAIGNRLGVTLQCVHSIIDNEKQKNAREAKCKHCGTVVARGRVANKTARAILCPSCLASRPAVPFSQRLRSCRVAAGLTRNELAQRSGVKVATIAYYESVVARRPQPETVRMLARVLGAGPLGPHGLTDGQAK